MTVSALLRAKHIGIKELKDHLSALLKKHQPIIATDHGAPTYFLIPYEEMIEVVEVLEELSDLQTVQRIAEGRKAYARGGWTPTASLWKKLSSPRS